jgi:hypothetical protein
MRQVTALRVATSTLIIALTVPVGAAAAADTQGPCEQIVEACKAKRPNFGERGKPGANAGAPPQS